VQISDGVVQTSGCTVRVMESGGSEGDGGGTTAYSTDGVVLYTPTQAETDQASFILIAKKSGCIPAAVTVITSASATAGKVVLSGETHTDAVIPTVTTTTTATNVTTVNGLASNVITAASIATDAIGADEIAANAITKIQAGLATPTNITAGTITTVTNLTNAPTNGDLTATMKTSVTTAATAATPTAAAVTGAVGSVTAEVTANVTKISGDATAADNAELFFDGTGYAGGTAKLQVEIVKVAGEEISGSGTALDPWGPAS
jgi:hypothetical protein